MTIVKALSIFGVAGLLLAPVAAQAQASGQSTEPPSTFDRIEKTLTEATNQAIDYLSDLIPYKMPEVQPNGDIVIRRDKPASDPGAESAPQTAPPKPGLGW